jgi:hypothetical protein
MRPDGPADLSPFLPRNSKGIDMDYKDSPHHVNRPPVGDIISEATAEVAAESADGATAPPESATLPIVVTPPAADGDDWDLESLALGQDFGAAIGVENVLTTVPVCKPKKEWWVRTHPDATYRLTTALLELDDDRTVYMIDPSLRPSLALEPTVAPYLLVASVTRQNVVFLWAIKKPAGDDGGRVPEWTRTALAAVESARQTWTRTFWDQALRGYRVQASRFITDEPVWPKESMKELVRKAFEQNRLRDWNDPILRRLRGEA